MGPTAYPYNNQQPTPNWNGGQNSYASNYSAATSGMGTYQAPQSVQFNPQFQKPQPVQPEALSGRVINTIEDVQPNEIPMDGSWTFFPVASGQEIYAMTWNQEGKIIKLRYILEEKKDPDQLTAAVIPNEEALQLIMGRLDELQEDIRRAKASYKPAKKHYNKPKPENKEGNVNV